jgi:hypothetical protein
VFIVGPVGDQGAVSTPIESGFAIYKQSAVWTPDAPTKPMLIVTNGKYDVQSIAPGTVVVAKANLGQIYKIDDDRMEEFYDIFVKPVGNSAMRLVNFVEGNGDEVFSKINKDPKMVDIQYESENVIPTEKPIIFRDRNEVVIGMDNKFRYEVYNHVQNCITMSLARLGTLDEPQLCPIGYGFFTAQGGKTLKLERRPNKYFRVGSHSVGELGYISKDVRKAEAIKVAAYTYMAAYFLMSFIKGQSFGGLEIDEESGKVKKGGMPNAFDNGDVFHGKGDQVDKNSLKNWTIHDFAAQVSLHMQGLGALGETELKKWSTVSDIAESLDRNFGMGYSISNRILWDSTADNWRNYYLYCLFLGFALARVKATNAEMEIRKVHGRGNENMGSLLEDANHGEFEGMGGISGLWLPCPRNDMRWQGRKMVPIPVVMDMDTEIIGERNRLEHANVLLNLTKFKPIAFSSVSVERGEIPSNTIDPLSTQQKYMLFKPTSDGRIVNEQYDWRSVIKYKFPRWGVLKNGLDDQAKRILFVLGLFTNGDNALKDGTLIPVNMSLISPVSVKYAKTKMNEDVIIKSGSDTKHDPSSGVIQKAKVGAGMTGTAVVTEVKPHLNEVKSPPPKKVPPVEPTVVDAIDDDKGDRVASEGAADDKGDPGTEPEPTK